jgi:hypothetical protein
MKSATLLPALALAFASLASAQYQGAPVSGGGSISGIVKAKGKAPADEERIVHKNEAQCGAKMSAQKYVISAAGGVKWAVASLTDIKAGKPLDNSAVFYDNKNCRFDPHVMVAFAGATLKVRNEDDMLHNSHFFLLEGAAKKNLVNLALPKKGQVIENAKILRKEGLVGVQCDAHDFMQGYIAVLGNPYGAVTGDDGAFKLTDVPAGTYQLKVWHEGLGEKVVAVTVEAGKDAKVAVEL